MKLFTGFFVLFVSTVALATSPIRPQYIIPEDAAAIEPNYSEFKVVETGFEMPSCPPGAQCMPRPIVLLEFNSSSCLGNEDVIITSVQELNPSALNSNGPIKKVISVSAIVISKKGGEGRGCLTLSKKRVAVSVSGSTAALSKDEIEVINSPTFIHADK